MASMTQAGHHFHTSSDRAVAQQFCEFYLSACSLHPQFSFLITEVRKLLCFLFTLTLIVSLF